MELTSHLVDKFQESKMDFRKILMGVTSERSRWNQCVEWTNKRLGMAVGALFIRDNFDNVAKVRHFKDLEHLSEFLQRFTLMHSFFAFVSPINKDAFTEG